MGTEPRFLVCTARNFVTAPTEVRNWSNRPLSTSLTQDTGDTMTTWRRYVPTTPQGNPLLRYARLQYERVLKQREHVSYMMCEEEMKEEGNKMEVLGSP